MSFFNTKQALLTQLINNLPTGLTTADIAFENKNFNPANKPLWLAAYFIPATNDILGKSAQSGNEDRGVFQVSVFVSLNNEDYDNTQLQAIDQLMASFKYNTQMVYTTQTVQALSSTVNNGTENESWFKRDISVQYLTFSTR